MTTKRTGNDKAKANAEADPYGMTTKGQATAKAIADPLRG